MVRLLEQRRGGDQRVDGVLLTLVRLHVGRAGLDFLELPE